MQKGPRQVALSAILLNSGFTDAEYLGSASRAHALGCRTFVLQGDLFWVPDLNLLSALHAVGLGHYLHLLLVFVDCVSPEALCPTGYTVCIIQVGQATCQGVGGCLWTS